MHPTKKQVYSILIGFSWLLSCLDYLTYSGFCITKSVNILVYGPSHSFVSCIPFYYTKVGSVVYLLCFVKAYRTLHDNGERIVSSLFGSIIHSHDEPFHIRLLLFSYYFFVTNVIVLISSEVWTRKVWMRSLFIILVQYINININYIDGYLSNGILAIL